MYCWIRRQRHILAIHKYIYYVLSDSILEDLQFDYLEKRLEIAEKRWVTVSDAVTEEGYLSPSQYADALTHPSIERRARRMLNRWELEGRPRKNIQMMGKGICEVRLYRDALQEAVKTPIFVWESVIPKKYRVN